MMTKAALPLLAGSIGTCQYPEARSNVENHFASERAHSCRFVEVDKHL